MAEITLTTSNFEAEVLNTDRTILVDFWATWCGPCRMLAPILEEIASEYEGKVTIGKVNVDEEIPLAMQYRIESIPTLILFRAGEPIQMAVGYRTKEQLLALLGL